VERDIHSARVQLSRESSVSRVPSDPRGELGARVQRGQGEVSVYARWCLWQRSVNWAGQRRNIKQCCAVLSA
jgi:hypothetical protein